MSSEKLYKIDFVVRDHSIEGSPERRFVWVDLPICSAAVIAASLQSGLCDLVNLMILPMEPKFFKATCGFHGDTIIQTVEEAVKQCDVFMVSAVKNGSSFKHGVADEYKVVFVTAAGPITTDLVFESSDLEAKLSRVPGMVAAVGGSMDKVEMVVHNSHGVEDSQFRERSIFHAESPTELFAAFKLYIAL